MSLLPSVSADTNLACFIDGNTAERGGVIFQATAQQIQLGTSPPQPFQPPEIALAPALDGPKSLGSPTPVVSRVSSHTRPDNV